jgi:tRNA modification GTPase
MLFQDTIAAISTAPGVGGIGIVRVTGSQAIEIVEKCFRSLKKKRLSEMQSHTIHYGHIINEEEKAIDEVLVMLMKAPHTFTREDVVEINCHGGPVPLEAVLMQIIKNGARLAENGEFTKRAFLNGRIDLSQVEAIMDVIEAKTELSLSMAMNQLEGNLSEIIHSFKDRLMQIIAQIEVSIDYPEYEEAESITKNYYEEINLLLGELKELLNTADTGKMLKEGVKTAIIGQPNVGKSSLLNALLRENKAIVTDIPGTTRDIVEAYLNIDGIPFQLLDTAGIRETCDIVEKIGVERSLNALEEADLILMLLDSSRPLDREEQKLLNVLRDKHVIYVYNKVDLNCKILVETDHNPSIIQPIIQISAKFHQGLDGLKKLMKEHVLGGKVQVANRATISNRRQKESLIKAIESLEKVKNALEIGMTEDFIAIDLHDAYGHLGMIVGEELKEEIIDQLFSRFCLGK